MCLRKRIEEDPGITVGIAAAIGVFFFFQSALSADDFAEVRGKKKKDIEQARTVVQKTLDCQAHIVAGATRVYSDPSSLERIMQGNFETLIEIKCVVRGHRFDHARASRGVRS